MLRSSQATAFPRHFPIAPPLPQNWRDLGLTTNLDDGHNPREHWLDHDPRICRFDRDLRRQGEAYVCMLGADGYLLELCPPIWLLPVIRDELPAPARPSGTFKFRQSFRLRIQAAEEIVEERLLHNRPLTRKEAVFSYGAAAVRRMLADCELSWREFVALIEARAKAAGAFAQEAL